ncbi:MAG: PEGA domain-containing protein [Proteobacteria bacterium]|nr:PEGA domain-containing protein [Pseudomonadota bacterium]MBQ9242167.1 PEGA domain-containing protein [Pseudomonadota bacterium]
MKFKRFAGMALAGMCVFGAGNAYAEDNVAVMKLDALGENVEEQAGYVLEALQNQVLHSTYMLEANGGDITYTEMQMVTGCDVEGSIACYDAACATLGAPAIIFGSVKDGGETHLVWYVSGKGIFKEMTATITDRESAELLARDLIIGEMGNLIVTSNVPGADVFVDGKRVGMSAEFEESAQPIELIAGNYIVAVRKDGFTKEDAIRVVIEGKKTAKIHVDMNVAKDPEDTRKAIKYSGFASLGVGGAALITGAVLFALTKGNGDKLGTGSWWEDNKIKPAIEKYDGHAATEARNTGGTIFNSGVALLGVGGGLLAAGVALTVVGYVYDFEGEDVDSALSSNHGLMPKVNFQLSPEYQGMTMGWKF